MKIFIMSIIALVMMTTLAGCGSASPTPPKLPTETLDLSELPKKEGKSYVVVGMWKPRSTYNRKIPVYTKKAGAVKYQGQVAKYGEKLVIEVDEGVCDLYYFGSRDSSVQIDVEPNKVYMIALTEAKKENFFYVGDPFRLIYIGNKAGKKRLMEQPTFTQTKEATEKFSDPDNLKEIKEKMEAFDKEGEKEFQRVYPAKFAEDL